MKKYFNNVDFLRFFLIWAIVLFHVVYVNQFDKFGLGFLKPYFIHGINAVPMFFTMAGFFLFLKPNVEKPITTFIRDKYIRLAPLIIVITMIAYLFHLGGFWGWNWNANISQMLLIQDWAAVGRFGQFIHAAWFASELFLFSIFYYLLQKSVSEKNLPIVIGIFVLFGVRFWVTKTPLLHADMGKAMACIGAGYFIADAFRKQQLSAPKEWETQPRPSIGWSIAEFLAIAEIFQILYFKNAFKFNGITANILFIILFWSFINRRGIISRILDNDIWRILGRYAYSIFIGHVLILEMALHIIFPMCPKWTNAHPWAALLLIIFATMALGVFGYHCVEKPAMRLIKKEPKNDGDIVA